MKKLTIVLLVGILALSVAACSSNEVTSNVDELKVVKIGASSVPHAQILRQIEGDLKNQGVEIEIIEYQDFVQPNMHLAQGEIDANFFQHEPYFTSFTDNNKITNLMNAAKVHLEPMGIYSKKYTDLTEVEEKDNISIPSDPTNMGRALAILEQAQLISLKEGIGINGTVNDITENQKNLKIIPLDAPNLPRTLEDVAISVINTNFALQANLNPLEDALFIEGTDSPYANVLTIRVEDKDKEAMKKLVEALQSAELKQWIEKEYKGSIIPAF